MNEKCPDCSYSISLAVPCGEIGGLWYCGSCYQCRIDHLSEPPSQEEIEISEQIRALQDQLKCLKDRRDELETQRKNA